MSSDDSYDDNFLLETLMTRLQLTPPHLNPDSDLDDLLSSVLNPSLPLSSPSSNGQDDSAMSYVAKEEARVEREIIRTILSGHTDSLRPNSGQAVMIGEHNICVGCRQERGSDCRIWEWHGHIMTYDEMNCYTLEYIYGNYFERMPEKRGGRKEREEDKESPSGGGGLGLRGLIGDGRSNSGRILRRNVNVGSPGSNA